MTTIWTLPQAGVIDGEHGHLSDHDNIYGCLDQVMNAASPLIPSGDVTGVTDTANIRATVAALGFAHLGAGAFYVSSTVTLAAQQYIRGAGRWATLVHFTGTGDCFRFQNAAGSGSGLWGGGFTDFTVDGGSHAGGASTAFHVGDGEQIELNVAAQNFPGSGDIGFHFDNNIWWTEKMHGATFTRNCTTHVVYDVTGTTSASSFGYLDMTHYIYVLTDQNGVVVQNGAFPYHGHMVIRGNVAGFTSVQNSVLTLTGAMPHAPSTNSSLSRCHLEIQVETGTLSNQPRTINFGSTSNTLSLCYGIMDFTQGAGTFTASNINPQSNAGVFGFVGPIIGDANLMPSNTFPVTGMAGIAQTYARSPMLANGNAFVNDGDFFKVTLTGNMTVNLNPGGAQTAQAPQRKTLVIIQAASGGPFTVAWPHGAGTNAAPKVVWPGGTPPTMSAGAGATDVYKLETYDGGTWFAEALQNVS